MYRIPAVFILCVFVLLGCPEQAPPEPPPLVPHSPVAAGVSAPMGEPIPTASTAQLAAFERGKAVANRRFSRADGLGPEFNVAFCAACHERPVTGGSAALYRNFFLGGTRLPDGSFVAGPAGGVVRLQSHGVDAAARPAVNPKMNVVAQRNPIPFFGVGLLAEVPESELLRRADPDDVDGDGISGRPNWDQGFVGRFGRKSQTVSIEGFIRGPLMNHLGITTDPLSQAQKAALPIDSSDRRAARAGARFETLRAFAQASAPAGPTTDDDGVPDPELSTDDLFDLVSFAMLLAAPQTEPATEAQIRGRDQFDALGCGSCHTPRLIGPRGPLHVYSDLLLHDMGPELADGLVQGVATGSEFRTQPLWGLSATGPYLHDGRAGTVRDAILMHAGEAQASRDRAAELSAAQWDDLLDFLESLGGSAQASPGLLPPNAPLPAVGEYGAPLPGLSDKQREQFAAGRAAFDRDFHLSEGVGQPRFNGDSCRACHFEPTLGGAGPRGVNVMRHGIKNAEGAFVPPSVGTVLHRESALLTGHANAPQTQANVFEPRQTPHVFGLGVIETIPEAAILEHADPYDLLVPDGISGRPSWTDGGRLGRFGWKAQVPDVAEFVRDAVSTELGMTLPLVVGRTFGRIQDHDAVPDPEMSLEVADSLTFFLRHLAPPPRQLDSRGDVLRGEQVFEEVGCAACHVPSLDGGDGPVWLYSDLLLHDVLAPGTPSIEEASATVTELRTPPLWGVGRTAPYLHDGSADTLAEAIEGHAGEAAAVRDAVEVLPSSDRDALMAFLETL